MLTKSGAVEISGSVSSWSSADATCTMPCPRAHATSRAIAGTDGHGTGNDELAARDDEVDLCVDVPEDRLTATRSSRGFGRRRRPTFETGLPSATTMSAVKSFSPRIREEPTPYASTGTPRRSNSSIFSTEKPPETTIRTPGCPASSSAARTLRTSRSLTPRGSKSPISSHSERSTSWPEVSSRTPHSAGPSASATARAVATESFSKSTRTVMWRSAGAHSANFFAASTVSPS